MATIALRNILLAEAYSTLSLPNDLHMAFMDRAVNRFRTFNNQHTDDNALPAMMQHQIGMLAMAFATEDSVYVRVTGSAYTKKIADLDTERDQNYLALKGLLEAFERFTGDTERQQAAQTVLAVVRKYKINIADSYEREGLKMDQMLQELLRNYQVELALKKLGAEDMLAKLKTVNDECRRIVNLRQEERAQLVKGEMLAARKECDIEYRLIIQQLNGAALLDETGYKYEEFIRLLNEDINYYRNVVLARTKSGKDEETPSDDEAPASDGSPQDGEVTQVTKE